MKHTRKIMLPICVTLSFVDDGEIIGTRYFCATAPPASDRLDATSPRIATHVVLGDQPRDRGAGLLRLAGVVERDQLDRAALDAALRVALVDREPHALVGRLAERRLRAGHRAEVADHDRPGAVIVAIAAADVWATTGRSTSTPSTSAGARATAAARASTSIARATVAYRAHAMSTAWQTLT